MGGIRTLLIEDLTLFLVNELMLHVNGNKMAKYEKQLK